jgi:hypothetical protein
MDGMNAKWKETMQDRCSEEEWRRVQDVERESGVFEGVLVGL